MTTDDLGDRTSPVERTFDASPERGFDAWKDPMGFETGRRRAAPPSDRWQDHAESSGESMQEKPTQHFEVVVVGGGQAGLVMGYYLAQQAHSFVILDAGSRVGDAWRDRWDSLRLFIPAGLSSLPGLPFPAADASFPTKDEMADYLESYADRFDLPVQLDTTVESLTRRGGRYVLATGADRITANHVVVATGPYHHPNVPEFAQELAPSITRLHSSEYRNPDQLPEGDVLVVGAGNSGAEIAMELAAADRRVRLAGRTRATSLDGIPMTSLAGCSGSTDASSGGWWAIY